MRKCSVLGCSSMKRNPKISFFSVPKANSLAWNLAVNNANCQETNVKFVCAEHFLPEEIITTYSGPQDIVKEIGNRSKFALKKGAVPSVFHYVVKNRKSLRLPVSSCVKDGTALKPLSDGVWIGESLRPVGGGTRLPFDFDHNYAKQSNINNNVNSEQSCRTELEENLCENSDKLLSFNDLIINFKKVVLPKGWMAHCSNNEIVFYKPNFNDDKMQVEKQLIFKSTLEISLYVYQLPVKIENISTKLEYPMCIKDITRAIEMLAYRKLCEGGPSASNFPGIHVRTASLENSKLWRHLKCPIIMMDLKKRCQSCYQLIQYFRNCRQRLVIKQSSVKGKLTTKKSSTMKRILSENEKLKKSDTSAEC